jgi:tetratricopeptide (TPR) repeat protein
MEAMRLLAVSILLLSLVAGGVAADDPDAKAEASSRVDTARSQLARGGYFDAIANLKKAVEADPTNVDAAMLLAGAYRDTGEYAKAAATVPLRPTAASETLRAEVLLLLGREQDAEAAAKAALALDPLALGAKLVIGRLQEAAGKRDEAVETYKEINRLWSKTDDATETDDMLMADARAELSIFRLSSEYAKNLNAVLTRLEKVWKRSPGRVDAMVEIGDLYMRNISSSNGDIEAKKWYSRALEKNPHYAPALFGKARQMAFRYEEIEAAKLCEDQVLRENPSYVPALLFLSQQALGDGAGEKARPLIERALAVNPHHPEARATRAAAWYLAGDKAAFEKETAEILAKDRFASAAYSVVAGVLEDLMRDEEALAFAEKAVAVDPLDWEAHFVAGRNALNTGDDDKGVKYLERAEKEDPFANVLRKNFLRLLKEYMRGFALRKDEKFVVRMPPEEEEPYYRLLRGAMGESLEALEKRWSVKAQTPLFISAFSKQEDFSTRTIGMPGLPALGVCFGRVVTLDSPRALPPGAFGWRMVEHHELAHVITLQLSKGRVPRWLTEGASVYEERKLGKTWNREAERDLIDAIASDDVLTLKDINNAFRGPRVLYAYYQGGLMCEMIERDFGFPKLREMVRLHGDGLDTDDVVRRALGIEPEEFDRRFLAYAKDYVKHLKVLPRPTKAKTEKLRRALRKTPDDAEGWVLACQGALALGDNPSALSALSNVARLLPNDGRVPALRALIAWREQKPDIAVRHAEEAIAKGCDLYELRMNLALFHAQSGRDGAKAKDHWRKAIELFPLQSGPGDPRLLLAKALMAEGEQHLPEVVALMRAHVDLDEDDVGTRKQLATMYAQQNRSDDELAMLEGLRDIVPLPNVAARPPRKPDDKTDQPEEKHQGWQREDAVAVHERLAEIYIERKRYADAELAWSCAVGCARMDLGATGPKALDPTHVAEMVACQGEALHLLGRIDEAKARLEEALRLDPNCESAKALKEVLTR